MHCHARYKVHKHVLTVCTVTHTVGIIIVSMTLNTILVSSLTVYPLSHQFYIETHDCIIIKRIFDCLNVLLVKLFMILVVLYNNQNFYEISTI